MIFDGAEAAVARINLDRPPQPDILERCRAENDSILELTLLPIAHK